MTHTKLVVTDVTGDGRADIVQFYDTGTTRQMRVLRSTGRTPFAAPATWLDTGTCTACTEAMTPWAGLTLAGADLDGDGPDDLVALRTTPDSKVIKIYTIRSTGTAYEQPVLRYTSGPDGL
jgi:hypothetical protein